MLPAAAQSGNGVNYSRWPQRPALWAQATELLKAGKSDEAQALLEKEAAKAELTPECRKILNELKFRQILSPNGSDKEDYTVKRGDNLFAIARKTKSSADYIMAINGITEPGRLSVGDRFKVRALDMKIIIDVKTRTISLIDKETVIKTYPVLALRSNGVGRISTKIKNETGHMNNGAVSAISEFFPAADKTIHLRNGMVIDGTRNATAPAAGFYLSPEDCNELSLLVVAGNDVEINH